MIHLWIWYIYKVCIYRSFAGKKFKKKKREPLRSCRCYVAVTRSFPTEARRLCTRGKRREAKNGELIDHLSAARYDNNTSTWLRAWADTRMVRWRCFRHSDIFCLLSLFLSHFDLADFTRRRIDRFRAETRARMQICWSISQVVLNFDERERCVVFAQEEIKRTCPSSN